MAAIARSLYSFPHHVLGYALQIVGPADLREEVDEGRREVERVIAELGRLVIPGKDVMVIVPAFTKSEHSNPFVLRRIDKSVVRFVAEHVSRGVHQPCHIQCEDITEDGGNEVSVRPRLVPTHDRNSSWQNEAQEWHQYDVISLLKCQYGIALKIT